MPTIGFSVALISVFMVMILFDNSIAAVSSGAPTLYYRPTLTGHLDNRLPQRRRRIDLE
jgi:hypothetical protein